MLSITLHDRVRAFCFELEGELLKEDTPELEGSWRTASSAVHGRGVVVDLRRVSRVDDAGEELLRRMRASGVTMVR
jgi:ABC-type transporter Mla MlaB component